MSNYRAADLLVDILIDQNISRAFCVPGESYLSVLDAFTTRPNIEVVTARQEGGAGFMALADAKTGHQPGVCFVSRGPGAMNASIALHSAQQDALPLIMFVGQVARHELGRNAFQEVDYVSMWKDMAKWVWQVTDANQLEEVVRRAFQIAQSSTPGPVVIALPEDMLEDVVPQTRLSGLIKAPDSGCDSVLADQALTLLSQAKRPLIVAGPELNHPEGRRALYAFATAYDLPVALSFRQQDLFPNNHKNYAGHLVFNAPKKLMSILSEADLILALGTRLGDVTTQGYRFPEAPQPAQKLIHVHPDLAQLGRTFITDLPIAASPTAFCQYLCEQQPNPSNDQRAWLDQVSEAVKTLYAWSPQTANDGVVFGNVVSAVNELATEDAIICVDAGNFSGWVQRLFYFDGERRMVSLISGAMGSGIPSGVAASLRFPNRQVIVFVGDGGFMMTGNELATAQQYGAKIKVIVSDNRSLATIRLHQEVHFPGRISATELANPDFVTLGKAHHIPSYNIEQPEEVTSTLKQALAEPGSALITVKTSIEHIAAWATLTQISDQQKQR